MLSQKWCYTVSPNQATYRILQVRYPISRKQAIYIIKKRLRILKIYVIVACSDTI